MGEVVKFPSDEVNRPDDGEMAGNMAGGPATQRKLEQKPLLDLPEDGEARLQIIKRQLAYAEMLGAIEKFTDEAVGPLGLDSEEKEKTKDDFQDALNQRADSFLTEGTSPDWNNTSDFFTAQGGDALAHFSQMKPGMRPYEADNKKDLLGPIQKEAEAEIARIASLAFEDMGFEDQANIMRVR
jgi:hypothetical protein|tara:strand:- start:11 stop:559 length:549 start_codon:yes stop_codon:yes gene_type:complete